MQIRDFFPCLNKTSGKSDQKGEVYSDADHSNHDDDENEIDGN